MKASLKKRSSSLQRFQVRNSDIVVDLHNRYNFGGHMEESEESLEEMANRLMFDSNLHEFGIRVGLICALEQGGKFSQQRAYKEIRKLWKSLKRSKKGILDNGPESGHS